MTATLRALRHEGEWTVLTVEAPAIAAAAHPGHFVAIATPATLLRRPFWIAGTTEDTLTLRIQPRGPATDWLTTRTPGASLDILGPLGRPLSLPGGPVTIVGAEASPVLTWLGDLLPQGAEGGVVVAGGGWRACAAAARAAAETGTPCWVALQPEMACGTGLCWTCAVPVVDGPPARACLEGPVFDAARVDWAAVSAERVGR
jgi:dihydroorotate dehydrogenase electron transfer subunit